MRTIPIGTAYAVWTGLGAALTVTWAMTTGGEGFSVVKVALLVGIVAAVVGLKIVGHRAFSSRSDPRTGRRRSARVAPMGTPWLELLGWVGSAILVWSLLQTQLRRLRVINLVGCVVLIVYNTVNHVWPMVGLNVVLAGINVFYLARMSREKHDAEVYEVLEVAGDDTYLRHVLRVHEGDIRRYNPHFVHDPFAGDPSYLVLRGDETVGVVLMRDAGEGTAQLLLDWVTPRHRDLTPGEFVFGPEGPFRRRGFRRVLTPPDMVEPYYENLGFRRDGDAYVL